MSPRQLRLWSLAALLIVATSACGTSTLYGTVSSTATPTGAGSSTPTPGSTSTSSTSTGTATPPANAIAFSPCTDKAAPSGSMCGIFKAPLDYASPSGRQIGMRVIKLPATDSAHRIGSLFTDPGGPGGSGVDFVEQSVSTFASLNRRFDIVGWDPRGVADPDPVSCLDTAGLDALVAVDPITDTPAEHQTLVDASRGLAKACAARSGPLLPHVGTDDVVRDLDGMRAAVGDQKLTYLGFSYGTTIGARYAATFPSHIRALVLDGDVDPSLSLVDQSIQQADSLEKSLTEFVSRCKAMASCPLGSDPAGSINKMLSTLDTTPVTATDGRKVGRGEALTAVIIAMYDTRIWKSVYTLFAQALSGDVSGIQLLTDIISGRTNGSYNHEMEANTAINCVDAAAPPDAATIDRKAAETQTRDPHFGAAAVFGVLTCADWPVHGKAAAALNIANAPPILLLGATGDPATPYSWSLSLHAQIKGSVLLTRQGFGHSSYEFSSCVATKTDAYLTDGTLPPAGTVCSSN